VTLTDVGFRLKPWGRYSSTPGQIDADENHQGRAGHGTVTPNTAASLSFASHQMIAEAAAKPARAP
jgi:hypothetical protein